MQMAPEDLAHVVGNPPEPGAKPAVVPVPEKPPGRTFDKREFLKGVDTGTEIDKKGRERAGKEGNEKVIITPETEAKYTRFLKDYLTQVHDALQNNPSLRDNPLAKLDIPLIDALMTDGKPDETKIDNLFSKPRGWMVATEAINRYVAQANSAYALVSEIRPSGQRRVATDPMVLRLGDAGNVNKMWYDKIVPATLRYKMDRGVKALVDINAIAAMEFAFGRFGTSATDLVMGGSILAGVEGLGLAAEGIRRSFNKRGTEIRLNTNVAVFDRLKNNAQEKAYLQALTGVDIDHLEEDPAHPGRLRQIPGTVLVTTRNADDIRAEGLKGYNAKKDLFKDLTIPRGRIDMLPEQSILNNSIVTEGFGQTAAKWEQEMIEAFKANEGGILDKWGRKVGDPYFCIDATIFGPSMPDYVSNLDTKGNIERFNKARQEVVGKWTVDVLTKILNEENSKNVKTAVDAQINAVNSNTDGAKRKEAIDKNITELQAERGKLTSQEAAIATYKKNAEQVNTAQEQFRVGFRSDVLAGRTIDQAISRIDSEITAKEGVIKKRENDRAKNIRAGKASAVKALGILDTTGMSTRDADSAKDRRAEREKEERAEVERSYDNQTNKNKEELNKYNEQVAKLLTLQKQDQEYKDGERKNQDEIFATAKVDLGALDAAHNKLAGPFTPPGVTGWGISEAMLLNQTSDEIMVLLNADYAIDVATIGLAVADRRGWPADQNSVAANREQVVLAMAEAKAQRAENEDPQSAARSPDFGIVTAWTVTEDQLRRLSKDQLNGFINAHYAASIALGGLVEGWSPADNALQPNVDRLDNATGEARNRYLVRHMALVSEKAADIDLQKKVLEEQKTNIDKEDNKEKLKSLELTAKLLARQGEIFSKSRGLKTENARFTDVVKVTNTETTYSKAERDATEPKGYYEILDMLFDYKNGSQGEEPKLSREEYFKQLYKFLPPPKLARLLNESFNLGLTPGTTNIDNVLTQLKDQVTLTRNISYPEIYDGMKDAIMTLGMEAVAA